MHGPDWSRSRGNCGTEEQDCCVFLDFVWNQVQYPPHLVGRSEAAASEGELKREGNARTCGAPWLGPGCFISTLLSRRFGDYALTWLQDKNIVPVTLEVPPVGSWPGMFCDSLSCFFSTSSSGLLFYIVAARAIALLVWGALWKGKLVHLGRLLFHAEERLCVREQKQRSREPASPLLLPLLQHITREAGIFAKRIKGKPTYISANMARTGDLWQKWDLLSTSQSCLWQKLTLSIPVIYIDTIRVRKIIFRWWKTQIRTESEESPNTSWGSCKGNQFTWGKNSCIYTEGEQHQHPGPEGCPMWETPVKRATSLLPAHCRTTFIVSETVPDLCIWWRWVRGRVGPWAG